MIGPCRDHVGANHTLYSGYLEVAEQNNIIVVFPQVKKGTPGNNEIGCWDTYGYTSPSFGNASKTNQNSSPIYSDIMFDVFSYEERSSSANCASHDRPYLRT